MARKFRMVGMLMAAVTMIALTASPAQADFLSIEGEKQVTTTGTSSADVIDLFGSTGKCTNVHFHSSFSPPTSTLTLTPVYKSCTFFGLPATVNFTSCDYLLHKSLGAAGTLDIACSSAGDAIDINVYSGIEHTSILCHVRIPAQTGKSGYSFTNSPSGSTMHGAVGNITATQNRTSIFCPAGTHTTTGNYTIQAAGIFMSGLAVN